MPFDSRNYRRKLGFTNQTTLKKHFKATDIVSINWDKIEKCNQRLKEIFQEINQAVNQSVHWENLSPIQNEIDSAYLVMKENNIFPRLNNNGRSPEDLYYNWMRGYIVCKFFTPALSQIFGVQEDSIKTVGHDSLSEIETFSKSPVADLELEIDSKTIRLEIQSGYTGVNDIKEHKVREAKRAYEQEQVYSYVVHFDLFNGTMAIVDITNINDNSVHWETRSQMEGQRVFAIPNEAFRWFLLDDIPNYLDILY